MNSLGWNYYFAIVGKSDNPLFELEHSTKNGGNQVDHKYLTQFVAHASLDLIEEHLALNNSMYLKNVDSFSANSTENIVHAFVGASTLIKFLLLHDVSKLDENLVKQFFIEMYELYCKFQLNPLYEHHTPIRSVLFEKKAFNLLKKYLP